MREVIGSESRPADLDELRKRDVPAVKSAPGRADGISQKTERRSRWVSSR